MRAAVEHQSRKTSRVVQRRPHRKSRNGCLRCKTRHVKCDENRPACSHCVMSKLNCVYVSESVEATALPHTPTSLEDAGTIPAFSGSQEISILTSVSAQSPPTVRHYPSPAVSANPTTPNLLHLELLYHFWTTTSQSFGRNATLERDMYDQVLKYALAEPYLMCEILALGALHLSVLRPAQQDFYRSQATELQTEALSLFNGRFAVNDMQNKAPGILFSSFLGIHALSDTLSFRPPDFCLFIDHFISYLYIHNGVYQVAKESWAELQASGLQLLIVDSNLPEVSEDAIGDECAVLSRLLATADLSPASVAISQREVGRLQQLFNLTRETNATNIKLDLVVTWPILLSPEFTDLLRLRRAEALAILAHFAVLLHYGRDLWVLQDGGRFLIESITKYLGSPWMHWLEWPNHILDMTHT